MADAHGGLHLVDRGSGRVVASDEAGERTYCLRFDPSSLLFATACSYQGGGLVRVDRVDGGILEPISQLERAVPRPDWRGLFDWIGDAAALAAERHPPARADFVDTLAHLAFSPDGRSLALFETSAIDHGSRRAGWRGDVVLFDAATWAVRWVASVDGLVTGDQRSLTAAGHGMGFCTEVAFVDDATVACGATRGTVLFYRVADGTLLRRARVHPEAPVVSLAVEPTTRALWAALGPGGGPPVRVPDR